MLRRIQGWKFLALVVGSIFLFVTVGEEAVAKKGGSRRS